MAYLVAFCDCSGLGCRCFTCRWNAKPASLGRSPSRRQTTPGRSGPRLGRTLVGGDFGSSSGPRWMFEPVAKEGGRFWFSVTSLEQLVAISDVSRERNKYKTRWLQRANITFQWLHSFLGFLKEGCVEAGQKCRPVPLGVMRLCGAGWNTVSGFPHVIKTGI